MTVCQMPDPADYDQLAPPEQYGAWRDPSGECDHDYCLEAAGIRRLYRWANPRREVVVEENEGYVVTAELADA